MRRANRRNLTSSVRGAPCGLPAFLILLAFVAFIAFAGTPLAAGDMTVRAHDAIGTPGGSIAVVLRSYESRPIGQGQLCMQADVSAGALAPLDQILGSTVFSTAGDVISETFGDLLQEPQQIVIQFESASATVNATDGPMAVYFLQLDPGLEPGQVFDLVVDDAGTVLVDEHGETVPIRPRSGTLTIRAPDDPVTLEAHSEDVLPGGTARVSMVTFEPVPLSSGQAGFLYDPEVVAGPPAVSMDPRHGSATFSVSNPMPGLIVVAFTSPDGTLNEVPGDIVELSLPTLPSVVPETQSPISLDPNHTFLVDAAGEPVPIALLPGAIEFGFPLAGEVADLRLDRLPDGILLLDWGPDCGSGTAHAIYRGDLALGYGSLAIEPGSCNVGPTNALLPPGDRPADFFLVVPHYDGQEGSYGVDSRGESREPALAACMPQADTNPCAP